MIAIIVGLTTGISALSGCIFCLFKKQKKVMIRSGSSSSLFPRSLSQDVLFTVGK